MSDSDDDAAFASADEGEDTKPTQSKTDKSKLPDQDKSSEKKSEEAKNEEKPNEAPFTQTQQSKGATGKGKKKGKQAKKNANKRGSKNEETKPEKTDPVEEKKEERPKSETPIKDEKPADMKEDKVVNVKEPEKKQEKTVDSKTDTSERVAEDKETLVKSPSGQNIQRESGTPDPKYALDQLVDDDDDDEDEEKDEKASSWSWGGFGSVMKVAQTSVSTFTNQVGEGFSTVMDTLENTLGAIPPEELALIKSTEPESEDKADDTDKPDKEVIEKQKTEEVTEQPKPREEEKSETKPSDESVKKEQSEASGGGGWWGAWGMSGLKDAVSKTTNIVQSTSKNLVTGGIDVLETVGKKAFDFIEEHDPGIHRSKVLFERGNKPNLSKMLKEAKEETEYKAEMEKESEEARKAHFGFLFDEYQGISHLEALEILSNQCEKKVQTLLTSLPAETLSSIKSELIQIKQIFEHENDDDTDDEEQEHEFIKEMTELLTDLHLGTAPDKINKVQEKIRKEITEFYEKQEKGEEVEPKTMHQKAIQSLAELTSKAMEQFHKAGELILIQKDSDKSFVERAKCLLSINKLLSTEVSILSTKFSRCLNKLGEDNENDSTINQMVTNVYLEASNSSTYIHDGFRLLLPCLQQAAIENTPGIKE